MLYLIKIGLEEFYTSTPDNIQRMFSYCESEFGFKGDNWEEIKDEYDYEAMGELLESKGIKYQEFIE